MSVPKKTAISLPIPGDLDTNLEMAIWAENQGYDSLWLADTGGIDALTMAAAIATATHSIRIGTAVVPTYTRTPAVFASTLATLSHLAPDRIILGLGSSSHAMIEGWHGLPFKKPLTHVKETTLAIKSMLTGEKSAFNGEMIQSNGYRLTLPPKGKVPIYLAGLREKMLQTAGELGDGVILNLYPVDALPKMMEHIETGAKKAGKKLEDMEIVCRQHGCITDDPAAIRERFRQAFAPYFATPVYNKFLAWCGYPDEAEQISRGWAEKNREMTTSALTDDLVDKIAVIGNEATAQAQLRKHIDGGITTPMITATSADMADFKRTYQAYTPKNFTP